jgi:hypothetical protein
VVRLIWLVMVAIQGLVAPIVPVLDARAEAQSSTLGHVEERSSETCRPPHDHAVCQLCQTLRTFALSPAHSVGLPEAYGIARPDVDAASSIALSRLVGYHPPRAPPSP